MHVLKFRLRFHVASRQASTFTQRREDFRHFTGCVSSPPKVCDTPILGKASCLSISSIDVFHVDVLFVCFFSQYWNIINSWVKLQTFKADLFWLAAFALLVVRAMLQAPSFHIWKQSSRIPDVSLRSAAQCEWDFPPGYPDSVAI